MILISDFDNTLYSHSDQQVLTNNLQASQAFRQAGNKFVLATGRNASSLDLVLPNFYQYFDYIILDNGAVRLDRNGKIISQHEISEETARHISQDLSQALGDDIAFVHYHSDQKWPTIDHDMTKIRCWATDVQIGNRVLEIVSRNYGSQVYGYLVREALMSSVEWIKQEGRFRSFVDIVPKDAGKENAVRHLASMFPSETIITVGDDTNDLDMLMNFNGYAMQDSAPEVLAAIPPDRIISSVAELID